MGPKNEITHVLLVFLILRLQAEENEVFQPAARNMVSDSKRLRVVERLSDCSRRRRNRVS